MTRRRTALAGIAIAALYVASAAFAGHLSPLARGPLLDDGAPPQPYRWVSPPPALAATNQHPASATTDLALGSKGSEALSGLTTSDKQAILIMTAGLVPPHGSDTKVRIDLDPVDAATLAPLGHGLSAFGNAYRVTGTYLPSKTKVTKVTGKLDIVLTYPVTADLYANRHQMLYAPTGTTWTALKSTDLVSLQQLEAQPLGMGYVVVAGVPGPPVVTSSPVSGGGGSTNTLSIALAVLAGVSLLIGLGLMLRNRRPR